MRKLIVGNMQSLDGYYEGKDRNLGALFEYFHDDYAADETLDNYFTERLRAADTLLLTIPNQLGVAYNAHVIESVLKHVAPALGWR